MPKLKTLSRKQELFCLEYIQSGNASLSILKAGYNTKNPDVLGAENLGKPSIQARLASLKTSLTRKMGDPEENAVASVAERQKRLTEYIRANLVDFMEGDDPRLDKSIPNHGAVSEYSVRFFTDKDGELHTTKKIKLLDPIAAISELNKMERVYDDRRGDNVTVNYNIIVASKEGEGLLKRVIEGERTERKELMSGSPDSK